MWSWLNSVFYVEESYSKYLICISIVFPIILENCTLVGLLCLDGRLQMSMGVLSKEEENWRKRFLQLGVWGFISLSLSLSPQHSFYFPLASLELRIYTLLGTRLPEFLVNGMNLLPREMLCIHAILHVISGIWKSQKNLCITIA